MSVRRFARTWMTAFALVALLGAQAGAHDLADAYVRARAIIAKHLGAVQLNSVYGTPAFDSSGRRVDDIYFNFTGQDAKGRWMIMSLTLAPGGALLGEHEDNNPREDRWGHHEKPPIELDAWYPPEEAVAPALSQHPGRVPKDGISLAYHVSKEFQGKAAMTLYWVSGNRIWHVTFDGKYGKVLEAGDSPMPRSSRRTR